MPAPRSAYGFSLTRLVCCFLCTGRRSPSAEA